ncbi:MAG: NAD+ synthase [Methanobrevibacter sp.]|jgi:NAD+ synthase|nr:NAD+ synthase [Methanobrevibacter sp.]
MSILVELSSVEVKKYLIDFIKEIAVESKTNSFVVGLSGGIDSTCVTYLLKEAVSNKNIYAYHLYSSTTPQEDTDHARLIADKFNLNYEEIGIDSITESYLGLLNQSRDNYDKFNEKLSEGNLKARIRMSILYYFANQTNSLVAGTGNRSELLIGYFTKFGDGGCDFELIGDIYKTQLRSLAKEWGIPEEIINKPPRAALWENQSDEDEIGMTYELLDQILYLMEDKKYDDEDILKELQITLTEIDKVRTLVELNRHKIQCPPSPLADKKLF